MNEEVYARIEAKLDKHTDMLIGIKDEFHKELSLMKLAQQRLKYGLYSVSILFALKVSLDYPSLVVLIKTVL